MENQFHQKKSLTSHFEGETFQVKGEKKTLNFSLLCFAAIVLFFLKINFLIVFLLIVFSASWVKIRQGQLLGQCVKVTDNQLPEVYEIAQSAAQKLSMEMPDVFVKQDPYINAYALGFMGKKSVVLHSKTVESMTPEELSSIIGHEFTHIKYNHTNWIVITNSSEGLNLPIISNILGFIFLIWSRKTELTADRGGLLASRDLNASVSALAKVAIGEKLFYKLNLNQFIGQKKDVDSDIISSISQTLSSHPYIVKRFHALDLFHKSDLYEKFHSKTFNSKEEQINIKEKTEGIGKTLLANEKEEKLVSALKDIRISQHISQSNEKSTDKTSLLNPSNAADGQIKEFKCPKCKKNQEKGDECIYCGIIFDKYYKFQQKKEEVRRRKSYNNKSLVFGVLGIILQIAGNLLVQPLIFVIGTLLLLISLSLYAKTKGRNPAWGLLGLLSFLGVIALACLKDITKI